MISAFAMFSVGQSLKKIFSCVCNVIKPEKVEDIKKKKKEANA